MRHRHAIRGILNKKSAGAAHNRRACAQLLSTNTNATWLGFFLDRELWIIDLPFDRL